MRRFSYLYLLIVFATLHSACAQNTMIQTVTFKSNTRGGQKMITVSESSVNFTNSGTTKKENTESADWKKLVTICNEVDLDKVDSYDPPSSGRSRDAAWHSSIIIKTEDGTEYSTVSFDNAKAPKELTKIMSFLIEMDDKYNKDAPVIEY